jgi:hypothetical protein
MSARLQLAGQRFGRLLALRIATAARYTYWVCQCDCGSLITVRGVRLTSGETKSCGCLRATHARQMGHNNATRRTKDKAWRDLQECLK